MKIAFDAKRAYNNFTGLGNYSRFVIRALAKHYPEHQYQLITPEILDHPEAKELYEEFKSSTFLPEGIYAKPLMKSVWRSMSSSGYAKTNGADIFHGLSNELPRFKNAHQIKKIVTIHDLIFLRLPHLYSKIDRMIYNQKFKSACAQADLIIAVSEQTKADLIQFYKVPEDKIKVIYQGLHPVFETAFSDEQLKAIKDKYNLPNSFLLSVGTIEKRKNAKKILEAYLLPGNFMPPLVLVGKKTDYQKELIDFAALNRLEDKLLILNDVSFADLPGIYRQADLLIYPSLFEGFGIPVIEAIKSGLPVIASNSSCLHESGGPHSLYFDPNDAGSLREKIELVLCDEPLKQDMIAQSKVYIERFESKQIASELMDTYHSLLGQTIS